MEENKLRIQAFIISILPIVSVFIVLPMLSEGKYIIAIVIVIIFCLIDIPFALYILKENN